MVLAGLFLPSRPQVAVSILAGQLLAAVNFFLLEKIVKLFTQSKLPKARSSASLRLVALASLKGILVYGGALAMIHSGKVSYVPLIAGLSLPLFALVMKAIALALGFRHSVISRRATSTGVSLGNASKPAASLFLLVVLSVFGLLAGPGIGGAADPPPHAAPAATSALGDSVSAGVARQSPSHGESPTRGAPSGHGESQAAHGGDEGVQHLPNWVTLLNDYFPDSPVVHWMHENEYLVFAWLAGLVFLGFTWFAMRRPTPVPGQLQNALEWMVDSMRDVCEGLLGKHVDRYFPYIMAIFFYILTMNLIGIVPGFKSSTSTLDVTLALALITFVYVQFTGLRKLGLFGYLDHLAGSPRDLVGFIMLPVMVPVHILGELVKPISLSCRLFGNIFGEDTLIVVFVGVAAFALKQSLTLLAVPPMAGITALFMMLQTLTAIVQALIFALLTTVYLYMMLPHDSHEAHEGHAHDHETPHRPKEVTA